MKTKIIDILPRQRMDYFLSLNYIGKKHQDNEIHTVYCLDSEKFLIVDGHTRYYSKLLEGEREVNNHLFGIQPFTKFFKNGTPRIDWNNLIKVGG